MQKIASIVAALALAGLAGCGGGDDHGADPVTVETTVPASATASPEAYVQFVGRQAPDDQAEPLDLQGTEPPVSETDEPVEVS